MPCECYIGVACLMSQTFVPCVPNKLMCYQMHGDTAIISIRNHRYPNIVKNLLRRKIIVYYVSHLPLNLYLLQLQLTNHPDNHCGDLIADMVVSWRWLGWAWLRCNFAYEFCTNIPGKITKSQHMQLQAKLSLDSLNRWRKFLPVIYVTLNVLFEQLGPSNSIFSYPRFLNCLTRRVDPNNFGRITMSCKCWQCDTVTTVSRRLLFYCDSTYCIFSLKVL